MISSNLNTAPGIPRRLNLNRSLKLRFIFFVTLLTFITMSLVVVFSVNRERGIIIENVLHKSNLAARTIARVATDSSPGDIKKTIDICNIILKDNDFNSVVINKINGFFEDRTSSALVCLPPGHANAAVLRSSTRDELVLYEDIFQIKYYFKLGYSFNLFVAFKFNDGTGGEVWLEVSLASAQKAINRMIWQNFILTAMVTFFGGLISVFMAGFVLRPLNFLILSTKKLSEGSYDAKMPVVGHDEVSYLSSVFNEMVERLEQKDEFERRMRNLDKLATIGQLSAGIAHEIKNPLTSIRSLVELLNEEDSMSDESKRAIKIILTEVDRLNRVTNEFVALARPQKDRNLKFFEINDVIENTIMLLRPQFKKNSVSLHSNLKAKVPIYGDPDELAQVFLNIIINSMQAFTSAKTNKSIIINTFDKNDMCSIEIIDNGCGIDSGSVERIFMPFFTNKSSGTGLGLSIVKKILDEMKAVVSVESKVENGTAFKIEIPIKSNYKKPVDD